MAELKHIFETEYIPRQAAIHDVQSTEPAAILMGTSGFVAYTNNALGYEDYNHIRLWDAATNIVKGGILYSKVDLLFKSTLNATANAIYVTARLVIPDTAGDIIIEEVTIPMLKKDIDFQNQVRFSVYNGAKAVEFGFKLYVKVTGGNVTVSNKTLLIRI